MLSEPSPQSYLGLWSVNTTDPSSAFSKPLFVRNYIKGTLESTFAKSQEIDAPDQGRMALPVAVSNVRAVMLHPMRNSVPGPSAVPWNCLEGCVNGPHASPPHR